MTTLEAMLSMMLNTSLKPLFVRYVMFSLNVVIVEVCVKYFNGVSNIAFNDQSYRTNIFAFPSIGLSDNFPVKSTFMVPFFGFRVAWCVKKWLSLSTVIGR